MGMELETGFAHSPACIAGIPVCFREVVQELDWGEKSFGGGGGGGGGWMREQIRSKFPPPSEAIFLAPVSLLNESCLK